MPISLAVFHGGVFLWVRPGVDSPPIWKSYLRRNIFLLPPNLNSVSTLSDHAHIGGQHLHPESLMMNYSYNPAWNEGAIKPPIFQTSTFEFKNAEEGKAFFELACPKPTPTRKWASSTPV